MVGTLLIALLLGQPAACRDASTVAMARAEAFDLAGAADALTSPAAAGCADAEVAAHYLQGWLAARGAYRFGGSPESLAPVRQAIAALDARGAGLPGLAQVARFVLLAASAAAQSQRDEMTLLLEHAMQLESIQMEAGQGGAPGVTAQEAAGDLLLQVHRYDDARQHYLRAAERVGRTPRIRLGLARTARRLNDPAGACDEYRALLTWWGSRSDPPAEIAEAREAVTRGACLPAADGR